MFYHTGAMFLVAIKATFVIQFHSYIWMPPNFHYSMCCVGNKKVYEFYRCGHLSSSMGNVDIIFRNARKERELWKHTAVGQWFVQKWPVRKDDSESKCSSKVVKLIATVCKLALKCVGMHISPVTNQQSNWRSRLILHSLLNGNLPNHWKARPSHSIGNELFF